MINREKLIQELHAHDTRNCPEPPRLEDRPDFIRRYYEDVVDVLSRHVTPPPPQRRLVWEGCCDRCGHKAQFETGGLKPCKWGRCNGEVRPRIVEL